MIGILQMSQLMRKPFFFLHKLKQRLRDVSGLEYHREKIAR